MISRIDETITLTERELSGIQELNERFGTLSKARKDALRVPLARLNSATRRMNMYMVENVLKYVDHGSGVISAARRAAWVDAAIDLGIGMEALFLPRGSLSELQFRLGVHAARLLEDTQEKREEMSEKIKTFYRLRSVAVHEGRLDDKIGIRVLYDSRDLLARALRLVLLKGGDPNWSEVVFG